MRADDEIGVLVDSFNRMTGDLAASQSKLEETYRDLQAKHDEVEQRRRYTETVLEAVATGVVSLDPAGTSPPSTAPPSACWALPAARIQGQPAAPGFRSPEYAEIAALIQRMGRARDGMLEREVHFGATARRWRSSPRRRRSRAPTAPTWAWCWPSTT